MIILGELAPSITDGNLELFNFFRNVLEIFWNCRSTTILPTPKVEKRWVIDNFLPIEELLVILS